MNEAFEQFKAMYPRNGDEASIMFHAWMPLLHHFKPVDILEGTKRWVEYWQRELTPTQFIPKPVAFLRGRQFLDIPSISKTKTWEPKAVSSKRFTAAEANEPKISGPIRVKPPAASEPSRGFRSAKEILASKAKAL